MCDISIYKPPPQYDSNLSPDFINNLQAWVQLAYDDPKCKWNYDQITNYLIQHYGYDKDLTKCICRPEPVYGLYTQCNNPTDISVCKSGLAPKCWDERAWSNDCIDEMNTWITNAESKGMSDTDISSYLDRVDTSFLHHKICTPLCTEANAKKYRYTYPYRGSTGEVGNVYIPWFQKTETHECDPKCSTTKYKSCPNIPVDTPSDCKNDACLNKPHMDLIAITQKNQECAHGFQAERDSCECISTKDDTCPKIGDQVGIPYAFIERGAVGKQPIPILCRYPGENLVHDQQSLVDLYDNYLASHPEELKNPIWSKILANYCLYNIHPNPKECSHSFGNAQDDNDTRLCTPIQADSSKDGGKQCRAWYEAISAHKKDPNHKDIFAPFSENLNKFCRQEDTFYDPNNKDGPLGIWKSEPCSCVNAPIAKEDTINQKYSNKYTPIYQELQEIFDKEPLQCWLEPCKPSDNFGEIIQNPLFFQSDQAACNPDDDDCCPKPRDCQTIIINDGSIDTSTIKLNCITGKGPKQRLALCDNNVCFANTPVDVDGVNDGTIPAYPSLEDCVEKCQEPPGPSPGHQKNIGLQILFYILLIGTIILASYIGYKVYKYKAHTKSSKRKRSFNVP